MRFSLISLWLMWLAASSSAWSVQLKPGQLVRLRDLVEVDHEIILLSDLLPQDATPSMKSASNTIQLGRAPQIGSIRILEPEQIAGELAAEPNLLAAFRMPARITIRRFGWPIQSTAARNVVSVFLRQKKSKYRDLLNIADLRLDNIGALQENPALTVTGMEWDDRQKALQFRLRCTNRTICGSFLVHAVLPPALTEKWRPKFRSELLSNTPGAATSGSLPGPALAEKGKPAMLVIESASLRISIPVVCLGRGALNQQIRVLDTRTHRVFDAEVVGAALLHASL